MAASVCVSEEAKTAVVRYDRPKRELQAPPPPDTLCVCLLFANTPVQINPIAHLRRNVHYMDNGKTFAVPSEIPSSNAPLTVQTGNFVQLFNTARNRLDVVRDNTHFQHIHVYAFEPQKDEWCEKYTAALLTLFDDVAAKDHITIHKCSRDMNAVCNCIEQHCGPDVTDRDVDADDHMVSHEMKLPLPSVLAATATPLVVLGADNIVDSRFGIVVSKRMDAIVFTTCMGRYYSVCIVLKGFTKHEIEEAFNAMDVQLDDTHQAFVDAQLQLVLGQEAVAKHAAQCRDDALAQRMHGMKPPAMARQASITPHPPPRRPQ